MFVNRRNPFPAGSVALLAVKNAAAVPPKTIPGAVEFLKLSEYGNCALDGIEIITDNSIILLITIAFDLILIKLMKVFLTEVLKNEIVLEVKFFFIKMKLV